MRTRAVILDVGGVLARNIWEPMFDGLAKQHRLCDSGLVRRKCS